MVMWWPYVGVIFIFFFWVKNDLSLKRFFTFYVRIVVRRTLAKCTTNAIFWINVGNRLLCLLLDYNWFDNRTIYGIGNLRSIQCWPEEVKHFAGKNINAMIYWANDQDLFFDPFPLTLAYIPATNSMATWICWFCSFYVIASKSKVLALRKEVKYEKSKG